MLLAVGLRLCQGKKELQCITVDHREESGGSGQNLARTEERMGSMETLRWQVSSVAHTLFLPSLPFSTSHPFLSLSSHHPLGDISPTGLHTKPNPNPLVSKEGL